MTANYLLRIINSHLSEPQAGLLAGMLFGVKAKMPHDFYEQLVTTGTLHVVSLSGMNISIITKLLFDGTSFIFGKIAGTLATIGGIIAFVFFVGPSPSIVRAAIMGSLTILGSLFGRKDIPLLTFFLTAVTMYLFNHEIISNLSFQLSFLSTFGIILFSGNKKENKAEKSLFSIIKGSIRDDLKVSLSAQLFTLPIILFNFRRLSLISPIANIFVGWLLAPITYLGFLALFISFLSKTLGFLAFLIVWVPLTVFVNIIKLFSLVPFASIKL